MTRPKLLLLWLLCVLAGVISGGWMLLAIIAGSPRADSIALGFDQLGNVATGGDEDMLISTRCWINRSDPVYARWMRIINWLFNDPDHCKNSYLYEKSRAVSVPEFTSTEIR